jgi:hypothetical protein
MILLVFAMQGSGIKVYPSAAYQSLPAVRTFYYFFFLPFQFASAVLAFLIADENYFPAFRATVKFYMILFNYGFDFLFHVASWLLTGFPRFRSLRTHQNNFEHAFRSSLSP